MAAPVISVISPASGATGSPTNVTVEVTFDQEVDHSTTQIILEGADTDRVTGPDFAIWDDPTTTADDDILATPGYKGIVAGTLSFVPVDSEGVEVSGTYDFSGSGSAWRTKAVFTPTLPLAPDVEYKVYVVGDDDGVDDYESGASTRTVFDTQQGANLGTGSATFSGGYNGAIDDKVWVEVLTTGDAGDVRFKWWRDSAPLIVRELKTTLGSQLLADGTYVKFEGELEAGDEYSAVVKPPVRMTTTYIWLFSTGDGSFTTVPDTVSSPATGFGAISATAATTLLSITDIVPAHRATNLPLTDFSVGDIVVTFSEALDSGTIDADSVVVAVLPVNGDESGVSPITYLDDIVVTREVSGTALTITLAANPDGLGPLNDNNLVEITFDSTVASTTGKTLGSDIVKFFTTSYIPLWGSVRRVRLDLGSLIDNIPDDTINLAVFEASLEANALSFGTVTQNVSFFQFARRQYVNCLAEVVLLTGMGGGKGGGGKSKRLADLAVTYQGNIDDLLGKALACMKRWEGVLTSSGALSPFVSQRPEYAIKGNTDPDRPSPGRLWEPVSSYLGADVQMPAANIKSKYSTNRRYRRDFLWPNRWRGTSGSKRWKDD